MPWLIYKHTSPSKKVYIGQTRRKTTERWREGKGYTYNKNTRFAKAIEKYGWDQFEHAIIEDNIVSQEKCNERERYWIAYYNSYDCRFGYNMTIGGDTISSENLAKAKETIQKKKREKLDFLICYELKKIFPNPTICLEWFINNGYTNNYKKANPILRVIGKENATCFGFHFCRVIDLLTFKPKSKIETNKNKGHSRKVICIDTGDIYNSLSDCARITGICTQNLSRSCKKHTKTHNMYFAYLDEYDNKTWMQYVHKKNVVPYNAKSVYCIELNKRWSTISACCNELGISNGQLSKILMFQNPKEIYKSIRNLHFCYDEQASIAKIIEKPYIRKDSKRVYCVEEKILFDSITKAEKYFNIKNILKCCKDWKYTSGGYHWCFEQDINNFKLTSQVDRKMRNGKNKKVVNINTKVVYASLSEAARVINRNPKTLWEAINNNTKCAGYYWEYV